jgi:Protein of unknown function (DUF2786)
MQDTDRRSAAQVDADLTALVTQLWHLGWQPADLVRIVSRRLRPPHLRLLQTAVVTELARYPTDTVDPRWLEQLAEAGISRWWPHYLTGTEACALRYAGSRQDFATEVAELVDHLRSLPQLERLSPLPGTASPAGHGPRPEVDDRVLARVRALLAKAESTTFPAEAETFTAGAHALMARHRIDHVLLAASGRPSDDGPSAQRLGVDAPYEWPKVCLLNSVAKPNDCRVVWHKPLGFCTVLGHAGDLRAVEVLFTSLLVQATTSLTRDSSVARRRSSTRGYRQTFLLSFATRIGERLTETTQQQTAEAVASQNDGERLLPVLASRSAAVDQVVATMFPDLRPVSSRTTLDPQGWAGGRAAADLAGLDPRAQLG